MFEKATIKENEIIIQLLKGIYKELGEEAESIDLLSSDLVNTLIESGKTEIYLIKSENIIIGLLTLTESQAIYCGGKYGALDEMYIRPEFRSKNIGKICIDKIRTVAKEKSWKRVDVTTPTNEKWSRTIDFYKKNGFVFTGSKLKLKT